MEKVQEYYVYILKSEASENTPRAIPKTSNNASFATTKTVNEPPKIVVPGS